MGRTFEVRRKSENLPVAGYALMLFSRLGTRVWLFAVQCYESVEAFVMNKKNRRFSRETAVFLLVCSREKGRIERKEVSIMIKRLKQFICI
jgi:hypothetical protein